MIVITPEVTVRGEYAAINEMLHEGLGLLHIRKPGFSLEEMRAYLLRIHSAYHSRLVLHAHHELAEASGIRRLHFSENSRAAATADTHKYPGIVLSTSIHSIDAFNNLDPVFEYAFLSPVYPSISKQGYSSGKNLMDEIKKRNNFKIKLVALGGMTSQNIGVTRNAGFDDIAVSGSIWLYPDPVQQFKLCRQTVQSY
jgi:thiamine-phosphate pyrophosphorylase